VEAVYSRNKFACSPSTGKAAATCFAEVLLSIAPAAAALRGEICGYGVLAVFLRMTQHVTIDLAKEPQQSKTPGSTHAWQD